MTKLTLDQLEHHLWMAAHIITGPIDASDYKTYIFPILFFKRISDVFDEELKTTVVEYGDEELARTMRENFTIYIPEGAHWKDVFSRSQDIGESLKTAFRTIETENDELYGIFGDAQWTNKERLPDHLIHQLLDHFNKVNMSLSEVHVDDMGLAYEFLIKKFADKANKKAGEFYTPRTIVRLMVNILDPQEDESVYDPACGTGGMLLETIHHVRRQKGDIRRVHLFGQEKNLTTEAIARMNLKLHGQEDFTILRDDTLRNPRFIRNDQLQKFDCVLANPPFSLKEWGHESWASDRWGRNEFGIAPKTNADFAWVLHMFSSMKAETGRMAVVLPHGVLFRGGSEAKIRKQLLEHGHIEAILGVASNLFYGTGIPASILVLRAKPQPKRAVLIINAEEIFTKGRAQNTLSETQSDDIYTIYQAQHQKDAEPEEGVARWVPYSELEENDFNLNIARYVQKPLEEETITVEEALKDFQSKLQALEAAENKLEALLIREGFEL